MEVGIALLLALSAVLVVWLAYRSPKVGVSLAGLLLLVIAGLFFGIKIIFAILLALLIGGVCFAGWRLFQRLPPNVSPALLNGASSEDRRMVMQMLREGKITAEEAQELLAALPAPYLPPADQVPVPRTVLASIIGGIMVAVGFVLPWAFIRMPMGHMQGQMQGHQSGYHVGAIGWLILAIGLLPAILATIPALDTGLRQGMLRAVLSATGLALTLAMLVKSPGGPGLWVCLGGFLVQLLSAVVQVRPVLPVDSSSVAKAQ